MVSLNLRFATKPDIPKLREVDPSYKYFGKRYKDSAVMIIAEIDGEIAGYLIYITVVDGYILEKIFVCPEYRKRGAGEFLLRLLTSKIHGEMDDFKRIFVETYVSKRKSPEGLDKIRFLRKMGFMVIGYDKDTATLRYEVAELSVPRIVLSDRFKPWYPEGLPYEVNDDCGD
jgi:GNAT superfamily N-acetyltransferase